MRAIESGPLIIVGNTNPVQLSDQDVGPSLIFQNVGLLDPRQVQSIDSAPGSFCYGFFDASQVVGLDATPVASAAANIFTVGAGTVVPAGGTGGVVVFTGVSATQAVSPNIPLIPFGVAKSIQNIVTIPATLDFGMLATVTTAAGSPNITVSSTLLLQFFKKGDWIAIPGAGSSLTAAPLIAQIVSIGVVTATTVVLSVAAGTTLTAVGRLGSMDIFGIGAWPYQNAGAVALLDNTQVISRALRFVNNSVSDTGYSITIRGYDIYGVPMTETIPLTANTTTYGKKAWKYVVSYQLSKVGGGTTVGTITVGTSDVFGLPVRSDFFEYLTEFYAGAGVTANGGTSPLWAAADFTNPATAITGDVRGTLQVGAAGGGASTAAAPNGTNRLVVEIGVPLYPATNANNLNWASLLGVPQFAG